MASGFLFTPLLLLSSLVLTISGSYVITAPKAWQDGGEFQVCVQVQNPQAAAGNVDVTIYSEKRVRDFSSSFDDPSQIITSEVLPLHSINVGAGKQSLCETINLPELSKDNVRSFYSHFMNVTGSVDGATIKHTGVMRRIDNSRKIVMQTDKYIYKPGQTVNFRVLTHTGPLMNVSTEPYSEIYITTPSRTRIAQWLDVDNSKGLVQLDFQLADEPEEGFYNIHVKIGEDFPYTKSFKVEEYVLPRFEVTVKAPKNVLGTDNSLTFTACAKYTFGEPVKGNISWEITNAQNYGCQVVYTRNDTISGCSDITVTSSEVRMTDCNVRSVTAEATVTEEGTGAAESEMGDATVYRNAVTFETLREDKYMKPNLPYSFNVLAKLPDGTPASGELLEICHGNSCTNQTVPADGIIKAYLTNRNSKQFLIQALVTRASMHLSKFTKSVKKFFSPSNSSLLIYTPEETLECVNGQATQYNLPVLFASVKQQSATVNVQVVSRGRIQYWKSEQYQFTPSSLPIEEEFLVEPMVLSPADTITGVINIPLTLPATASPKIKVLIWYIRDDGEVVSDAKEMKVEKCLPNNVDLSWSTNKTQPGFKASWMLETAPNSICGLGVVDKSVELLSPKSEILTVDNLFLNDQQYDISPWWHRQADDYNYCRTQLQTEINEKDRFKYNYFSDFADSLQSFDDSGLYVFSDLPLETRPCEKQETLHRPPTRFGGSGGSGFIDVRIGGRPQASPPRPTAFDATVSNNRISGSSSDQEDNAPRTDFPETWLWDLVVVPSTGALSQEQELPDTITEWVGRAVCVHPQDGVGLSQRAPIITFTPFFVDLTLPPSVKRGETLPVKISVFNYFQQTLPVTVILESSPEYDIVGESTELPPQAIRFSCLGAQEKQVHTVKIEPKVIGEVNITVTAYIDHAKTQSCGSIPVASDVNKRDTLIKPITVEAEGFLREDTWSKYACADDAPAGTNENMVELTIPTGMVEGSERAWVTAVGDLLAISLQYLGYLIRMPYGCGEQNMLNFAPNIFILRYLEATRQETPEAREKLLRFMRTGYQRQLLYRHNNGSYSAFGKADDSGSTWLTAFVLKSFAQAKPYLPIDETSFNGTRDWLLESYGLETCAMPIGKVFSKGMKGGLAGKGSVPLTAYILISLLESGALFEDRVVQKGYQCIQKDNSRDSYTLALKAYAYALTKNENTPLVIDLLMQQAVKLKNSTHWKLPQQYGSNALEVETAAYTILAMMALDPVSYGLEARKIVRWISSQRNGRGGFYSTQDTVVALQALASYEETQFQGDLNVMAKVVSTDFTHTFHVQESNKLVQQQVGLETLPSNVSFSLEGKGCAVLQTVLRYNDPNPEPSDAFSLRVESRTERDPFCVTKRLSACATYLLEDGASNMAVIEVNLVSGYVPMKEDLKKLLKDNKDVLKRYDVDGNKVSFYVEEFASNQDVCVNFRVTREVDVENTKPGSVVVYDYYQPEFSVSKTYNFPAISQCFY